MRIIGWGGKREGREEDELKKKGSIELEKRGFDVMIDKKGK